MKPTSPTILTRPRLQRAVPHNDLRPGRLGARARCHALAEMSTRVPGGMVQCALPGDYSRDDHPDIPVTLEQLVTDAVACRTVGALSVHLHPRRPADGVESLAAEVHDAVVAVIRAAVPDLDISCSTQEDIDLGGASDRVAAVRASTSPPDVVSLNLAALAGAGPPSRPMSVSGVFTLDGADALLATPWDDHAPRWGAGRETVAVRAGPALWSTLRCRWSMLPRRSAPGPLTSGVPPASDGGPSPWFPDGRRAATGNGGWRNARRHTHVWMSDAHVDSRGQEDLGSGTAMPARPGR
jgi:hypothetical protein